MTFSAADFTHIRTSLIAFLLALLVGGSTVYLAQNMSDASHLAKQNAQQQLNEARNRNNVARDDRDNLSTYAAEYDSWVKRKVIGDERRLDLIEYLEALRKQNLVLDFKYAISPQQAYTPNPPINGVNFDMHESSMNLQIELLHEGQLINFLDALNRGMQGWFMLDHCTLTRASNPNLPTQLKAECSGNWLTLKNRNAR